MENRVVRRRSRLGRGFCKKTVTDDSASQPQRQPVFPIYSKPGLGRSKSKSAKKLAVVIDKPSKDIPVRKNLFERSPFDNSLISKPSSHSKLGFGMSPANQSLADSLLNVTGIRSIRSTPSPDRMKLMTVPRFQHDESFTTSRLLSGRLEPPQSPGPLKYDILMQEELANLKPPVDPYEIREPEFFSHLPLSSCEQNDLKYYKRHQLNAELKPPVDPLESRDPGSFYHKDALKSSEQNQFNYHKHLQGTAEFKPSVGQLELRTTSSVDNVDALLSNKQNGQGHRMDITGTSAECRPPVDPVYVKAPSPGLVQKQNLLSLDKHQNVSNIHTPNLGYPDNQQLMFKEHSTYEPTSALSSKPKTKSAYEIFQELSEQKEKDNLKSFFKNESTVEHGSVKISKLNSSGHVKVSHHEHSHPNPSLKPSLKVQAPLEDSSVTSASESNTSGLEKLPIQAHSVLKQSIDQNNMNTVQPTPKQVPVLKECEYNKLQLEEQVHEKPSVDLTYNTEKHLSPIPQEEDSFQDHSLNDSTDLNTTQTFLQDEQTILEQEEQSFSETLKEPFSFAVPETLSKTLVKNKFNLETLVEEPHISHPSEKELKEIMEVLNSALEENANSRKKIESVLQDNTNTKRKLILLKSSVQRLFKNKNGVVANKENVPQSQIKVVEKNWFNNMKAEHSNLLKTPKVHRPRQSLMETILTPHSFSYVLQEQADDIFD